MRLVVLVHVALRPKSGSGHPALESGLINVECPVESHGDRGLSLLLHMGNGEDELPTGLKSIAKDVQELGYVLFREVFQGFERDNCVKSRLVG